MPPPSGLTKQYLRYVPGPVFGVVGSPRANVVFVDSRTRTRGVNTLKHVAVPACEDVYVWDTRKSQKVSVLRGAKTEVSVIAANPDSRHIAVGYNDGPIRVFDVETSELIVTFSGHRSEVTTLCYDRLGVRLVSGGKDTDVILWDVVNECGIYRLKGHKGVITTAIFMNKRPILVTTSKDSFVKFWDLETQHCFKTLVGHRAEVWGGVLSADESLLVTGSMDMELRVWRLKYLDEDEVTPLTPADGPSQSKQQKISEVLHPEEEEEEVDGEDVILTTERLGTILRVGKDRVVSMAMDPSGVYFTCHGVDNRLEIFKILSEEEMKQRQKKKEKKARKRGEGGGGDMTVEDRIRRVCVVRMPGKIKSCDLYVCGDRLVVSGLLSNNIVAIREVKVEVKQEAEVKSVSSLSTPGHRSDVRAVAFSSDGLLIATCSKEELKIWNSATQHCVNTMVSGYGLSCLFAPGDRHVILATKSGQIQIFDLSSGALLEEVEGHQGEIWTMSMSPDKRQFVSGGADKDVKFWDFELIADEKSQRRLTTFHTRTLKLPDDVLCVLYSPNSKYIAAALLDSTVKVFFTDSLKFFLSLYGHKLPVLSIDISSDSTLLVSGSADRNIKIWGLDFGDCHKSIFAHDNSVMSVRFLPRTHLLFSSGKDGKLKEWDADSFEHVLTLEGHHGEVWGLGVSEDGQTVVTSSHDKSLRMWERTMEPLVLSDERETEREEEFEKNLDDDGNEPIVPGETPGEVAIAGRKTVETIKSAEKIMESLEIHKEETNKLSEFEEECRRLGKKLPPPKPHPMFVAYKCDTPDRFVLETLVRVRSCELEESLLVLPFSYVIDLLSKLSDFIDSGRHVELCCRCLFFLLRIHQGQISTCASLLPVVDKLREGTMGKIREIRDRVGFNMEGFNFIRREVEQNETVGFFSDATQRFKEKTRKRKRRNKPVISLVS